MAARVKKAAEAVAEKELALGWTDGADDEADVSDGIGAEASDEMAAEASDEAALADEETGIGEIPANAPMADAFGAYMNEAARYDMLTKEEELELGKRAKAGDKDAKDELVKRNLRLVVTIAKKYQGSGRELSDLVQEGNIGLMTAVDRYDWELGYRFSTYATWWIAQAVQRYASQDMMVRKPVHMMDRWFKIRKHQKAIEAEGRTATAEELAERTGLTVEKVRDAIKVTQEAISLDLPIGEELDSTVGEFVEDENAVSPEDAAIANDRREAVAAALERCLTEREREVLVKRFGLDGREAMTLEEVGRTFGVTRERIRQIEEKAKRKMRSPKNARELRELL